jgi:hypothetical protein
MAGRPKHTKPDGNQKLIMDELKKLGFDVDDVHNQPGLYDLVVSGERMVPNAHKCMYVVECSLRVEIKNPDDTSVSAPSPAQMQYHMDQNHRNSYLVAYHTKDILRWFDGFL